MADAALARLAAALADRYRIERQLGQGGMATVYLARDVRHEREVALKVLRPELGAVLGAERFLAEIKITARLDHPHILTLIDSGTAEGFLYYVLPFVRGESLREKLDREKQLGLEEALQITRQVAGALDYAHRQGVVHRDIKPENVLIQEGEAMLADFGIALAVKEAGGNRLTETGLSLGTPQYMSPEQATGDRQLDARSDVYSLAAVLYEMLAGEPPVTGPTAQAMIAKLMTERPTGLRVVRDTVPPAVDLAVAKALAKTPADRFPGAGDFARALDVQGTAAGYAPPPPSRGRRALVWGGAVVGIGALVAGALVLGRHLGQRGPAFVLRERTQLTTSGNVQLSAISPDGKQLAYFVKSCTEAACTYPLLVQDVGGTTTRTILGGATSAYGICWSPDRRNLIVTTTIDGRYGTYLVSALGGTPRYLTSTAAAFWDGGDSLIVGPPRVPDSVFYLHVTSLDGSGRDSIRVPGPGSGVADLAVSPDGRWIFAEVGGGQDVVVVVEDRTGRVAGRWSQTGFSYYRVTRDALWLGGGWGLVDKAVVRVPFDPAQGTLGSRGDTVFSGVFAGLSLPDDGSALVLDQGSAEYSLWALDMADALRGRFPEAGLLLRSTTWAVVGVSKDGGMLLIGRQLPSPGGRTAVRLSVRPWAGGLETPVAGSGEPVYAYLADSTTIALATKTPQGVHLAAVNVRMGTERLGLDLPVSTVGDFTMLPDGWAWIPPGNDSIIVSRGGRRSAIPRPAWFSTLHTVSAEANGHRLVFTGWNTATFDSLGVAVVPVDGGTPTLWTAPFAEDGGASWLPDGSVALKVQPTQDIVALYRVRGPGQVERVGVVPRPVAGLEFSRDLRRAAIATRDYHGDVWMSRISRQ